MFCDMRATYWTHHFTNYWDWPSDTKASLFFLIHTTQKMYHLFIIIWLTRGSELNVVFYEVRKGKCCFVCDSMIHRAYLPSSVRINNGLVIWNRTYFLAELESTMSKAHKSKQNTVDEFYASRCKLMYIFRNISKLFNLCIILSLVCTDSSRK